MNAVPIFRTDTERIDFIEAVAAEHMAATTGRSGGSASLRDTLDRKMLEAGIPPIATCIGCGCTDLRACADCCHWVYVDRTRRAGVCSHCVGHLRRVETDGRILAAESASPA